jgi:hypothetical protein
MSNPQTIKKAPLPRALLVRGLEADHFLPLTNLFKLYDPNVKGMVLSVLPFLSIFFFALSSILSSSSSLVLPCISCLPISVVTKGYLYQVIFKDARLINQAWDETTGLVTSFFFVSPLLTPSHSHIHAFFVVFILSLVPSPSGPSLPPFSYSPIVATSPSQSITIFP